MKQKHYRTKFPGHCNFHNWWIKSNKGVIGQLKKGFRNLYGHIEYSIWFPDYQIEGNGKHTTEELLEENAIFRLDPEGFKNETKTRPRTITRRS